MPGLNSGLADVYLELGKILNQPQLFGLGERAPAALVQALMQWRAILRDEMARENPVSGDYLADELSQDADRPALCAFLKAGDVHH